MSDQLTNDRLELSKGEMLAFGYQVVDRLVDHYLSLEEKPVSRIGAPPDLKARFLEAPPEDPSPPEKILSQVIEDVFGNIMHTTHPRFMAFVPSPSNFVSVMAEALTAGFNPFAGTWMEASGPAQVELVTISWLNQLFGLPETAGGLFTSGGSVANLTALAVARHSRLGDNFNTAVVYAADQTHASLARGLRVLGFSSEQYRILRSDADYRLPIPLLEQVITEDRAAGHLPFCVIANAGTTNTGAIDPLPALAALCRRENLWLHVDAAYGGAAVLTAKGRTLLSGLELVDSLVIDPHKWLFQPYEIGCILVRDRKLLHQTFHYEPEYLQDLQGGQEEINYSEYGIQLTRSFRALKLWMSIKIFGLGAFRQAIARGFELAERAEEEIERLHSFELITPAQMGVITFRFQLPGILDKDLDKVNQRLVNAVIAAGYAMISSTQLRGQTVLRLCMINPRSTHEDVRGVLEHVDELGRKLVLGGVKSSRDIPEAP